MSAPDPSPRPAARPRFGIPARIFLGFALVLLSFGTLSVLSVLQHRRSAATLRLLHEGHLPLALALSRVRATEENFDTELGRVVSDPDRSMRYLSAVRRVRPNNVRDVLVAIERAERLDPPPEDQATLDTVRGLLTNVEGEYQNAEGEFDALAEAIERSDAAAVEERLRHLTQRQNVIAVDLRRAFEDLQQRIADTSRAAALAQTESVTNFAVLGFAALLAGLLVSWWSQRLLSPLAALESRVLAVARGDLAQRSEKVRDDEIGRLTTEFERMVAALAARDQRLRELQRTQDEIVASLRSGIVVVGADGTVRATNRAADAILGASLLEQGAELDAHGVCARLPGLADAVDTVSRTGEPLSREAIALSGDDARSVDLRVTPFGAGKPEVASGTTSGVIDGRRAVLAVIDDVSESLATKARLLQSERLAAMGRMAAHVTHEVRNPLSSIGLNVDLLREEVTGDEAVALLTSIQREVDRLTSVTEEYLRLARIPSPMLAAEPIEAVVSSTTRFVSREMDAAKVKLHVDIEPELGLVSYDEAQIRQSLLNLLRNAREAMGAGGTIDVRAHRERGPGEADGVAVSVADRGEGIPPERRERIFDLFYSTKERGTGLGLALVREIVLAHGGTVRCEDRDGGGTVFTIWLPRATTGAPGP